MGLSRSKGAKATIVRKVVHTFRVRGKVSAVAKAIKPLAVGAVGGLTVVAGVSPGSAPRIGMYLVRYTLFYGKCTTKKVAKVCCASKMGTIGGVRRGTKLRIANGVS